MSQPLDYHAPPQPPAPGALVAVAWVFIAFGILSAVGMVASLVRGGVHLDFGILGIFIGRGLIRLRPGWRTCALVLIWITLVGVSLVGLLALGGSGPATFYVGGRIVAAVPAQLLFLPLGVTWGVAFWQCRVLTRSDVRELFSRKTRRAVF